MNHLLHGAIKTQDKMVNRLYDLRKDEYVSDNFSF
jgi:hypothetical protein